MESGKMSSDTSTDTVDRHRRQTPHFLLAVYVYPYFYYIPQNTKYKVMSTFKGT